MTDIETDAAAARTPAARAWRLFDRIVDAGAVLAATMLVAVMLLTTVKVFYRYGLQQSLIGADQLSGTALLYIAFLGAAWVLRRDEHVTIDLLLSQLGARGRHALLVTSAIIGAAVCLVLAGFGAFEVVTSIQRGVRIAAEIEMLRAVNLAVIPIGFLLLGVQFLRRAFNAPKGDALPPPVISV